MNSLLPKMLSPFTWRKRVDKKMGVMYELVHRLPNQNILVLAQVAEIRGIVVNVLVSIKVNLPVM